MEKGTYTFDEFRHMTGGQSDREVLLRVAWQGYVTMKQAEANGQAIVALQQRVDEIESQANEAMANLTTPEAMMNMADKFLGGK